MYPWNRIRPFDPHALYVDDVDGEGPSFSCASCGCSSCRWDLEGGDFARSAANARHRARGRGEQPPPEART